MFVNERTATRIKEVKTVAGIALRISGSLGLGLAPSANKPQLSRCIKRASNFQVIRTLAVIRFNLGPRDLAILIDHVNRRVRNTVNLLPFVRGIAQTIGADNLVVAVGEDRKIDLAFAVRRDLLCKVLAYLRRIHANSVELYILIVLQQRP